MEKVLTPKLPDDVVEQELQNWIAAKCGQLKYDETAPESLRLLTQVMQDGKLVLSEGGTAKYKLRYPIEGQQDGQKVKVVTELDFKEGITYRDVKNLLKNADPNDAIGTALIYTAGLTNTPLPILEGLNMWDLTRVQLLTVFFVM